MSIDISTTADLEAICHSLVTGRPIDPEVSNRIEERADRVREELKKKGVTDIAVSLIRETRDECA